MADTNVGVYVRISRDDADKTGQGVARQERDARELAEGRGWTVADVYRDNDVSAFSGRTRPEYERLLADVEAGTIGGIVAWHPDRLHRSPRELERFIDVVETTGAKVATVQAGELDLSNASGRMTARVVGAVARHESEHKAERQRSKARQLAEDGKVAGGGTRPFGYESDRVTVNEAEAEVIRDLARRVLAGETLRGVTRSLTAANIRTVTGRPWTTSVVRRLLTSARIAGLRSHHGDVVADAVWPAIIDRPSHEALRRILLDPARDKRNAKPARSYLLTGLAYCGPCGAPLVARPRSDGKRCQVCATGPNFTGCGKIGVLTEPLEDLVVEAVLTRADSPALADVLHDDQPTDQAERMAELADLEGRQSELAEAWADGDITRPAWQAANRRLEDRLAVVRGDLAATSRRTATAGLMGAGTLAASWPDLTFDQRRAVLAAFIDRVVVAPAVRGRNYFDAERVSVTWRA